MIHPDLIQAIELCKRKLINTGYEVKTEKWQGIEAPIPMYEAFNVSFSAVVPDNLEELVRQVKPNLPWADVHFEERVGGLPLNPGESYKIWPFYGRDKDMRNEGEQFTHSYMERFWPKYANKLADSEYSSEGWQEDLEEREGLRYKLGDLSDLVNLLKSQPNTRQAYLPIWFPEDTGATHGGRVPCTLGYHFIIRHGHLHCIYYIRSCDFKRHFRDDIYLAIRLMYWLLAMINIPGVKVGTLTMHITSLHIFANEIKSIR